MAEILQIKNLTLSFKNRIIIKDYNLLVNQGDKVVLKGPSGIGKSSLINAILGFVIPEKGTIFYKGVEINKRSIEALRSEVAWLSQNTSALGRGLTSEVILKPFTFKVNEKNRPSLNLIRDTLAKLGLNDGILNQNFSELSGGEKQRIGLAICRLLKKELLLLDEPISAMDHDTALKSTIFALCESSETILSTSHNDIWSTACPRQIDFMGSI